MPPKIPIVYSESSESDQGEHYLPASINSTANMIVAKTASHIHPTESPSPQADELDTKMEDYDNEVTSNHSTEDSDGAAENHHSDDDNESETSNKTAKTNKSGEEKTNKSDEEDDEESNSSNDSDSDSDTIKGDETNDQPPPPVQPSIPTSTPRFWGARRRSIFFAHQMHVRERQQQRRVLVERLRSRRLQQQQHQSDAYEDVDGDDME